MTVAQATRRTNTAAVEIRGLVKTFGHTRALDGLDLTVRPGSVAGGRTSGGLPSRNLSLVVTSPWISSAATPTPRVPCSRTRSASTRSW